MKLFQNNYKEKNLEYLEEYAKQPGVQTLHNGVMYRILTKGNGPKPGMGNYITVHYRGKLINGKLFDATQSGKPATFKLGQLIDGWKTAIKEMPVGSRWEIVIPARLGYGSRAAGNIKAHSTLIFDIQLLGFE